ncbi:MULTISPECIES: ABC transporter ATP-binding protein [Corynebacterium]|uniref:ABC transporter ATP-binding protein n=1 Tax=Corynebacterium TaxID=1716 RepID=UPI0008A2761E|nr:MULTISPECIES: ABC transporter ATP-binding protein [Corynebacterium]MDK6813766.1 ABC transporter ATP-binding protein [Corynebacterium sp. UMB6689]OFP22010.1 ATP-binding protein [Corynebacterium sp. HMSC066C02]OFT67689.1 ATP-binding protein [Corynebacterium sp. HMSC05D03]QQU96504.1 ABC transporter ATP-binding protein [Corynebacterium aurimucosum]UTA70613.1 ABC transporter ATP-binding protein [Corynebacterium aurimucosum]
MDVELTITDLSAGYGSRTVVDGLSLPTLCGGQVVGLLGPNASGKTTTIKTLAGVHRARGGTVGFRVDGQVPSGQRRRQLIGYVPQGLPHTAALRAFEAVLIAARREACEDPVTRTAEVLHSMGLDDIAQRYLNELSGGQRQLVAVAQMLVGTPGLMLLDEPTSALDLNRQLFVLGRVRAKAREEGSLALVAIHDINLAARMCDQLVVLHGGKARAHGAPGEVLTEELLREVYGVETDVLDHRGQPVVALREVS